MFTASSLSFDTVVTMAALHCGNGLSELTLATLCPHKSVCQPCICQPLTAVSTLRYIHRLWHFWSSRSVVLPGFKNSRVHSEQYRAFKNSRVHSEQYREFKNSRAHLEQYQEFKNSRVHSEQYREFKNSRAHLEQYREFKNSRVHSEQYRD